MLEVYLDALGLVLPVVQTVPVWGPLLLVGAAALAWRYRPRRAVPGHVQDDARTDQDTGRDAASRSVMTCADTRPDVSGHEARGDQ
ncbi:hypothetical protein [Streptomyces sp. KAU_LT]|uniref:hypothetical protein n=1 Tax=Streptomyces sp. KAU_LT TaxID=3046669 RepID=UPI0024B76539|nr:hypothetical protein [Streptomyces sp. KAU_LT]MDI9836216.1 hypothetical protein [Streptomyces sp. KAU_LT]